MSEKTFTINLYCKNCGATQDFVLPKGTWINRAPYLGYDSAETKVVYPDHTHHVLKCQFCEVGNVA